MVYLICNLGGGGGGGADVRGYVCCLFYALECPGPELIPMPILHFACVYLCNNDVR